MKKLLQNIDLTSIFKDKRFGDLRRWSAKRTVGGVIVIYTLESMKGNITWEGVILCLIGVLPLCLSMFETTVCKCKCKN